MGVRQKVSVRPFQIAPNLTTVCPNGHDNLRCPHEANRVWVVPPRAGNTFLADRIWHGQTTSSSSVYPSGGDEVCVDQISDQQTAPSVYADLVGSRPVQVPRATERVHRATARHCMMLTVY